MFRATFEIAFAKAVINYICSKFYWPLYCCFFSFVFPIIPGKRKGLHKMSKTFIFSGVNISRGEYFSGVNIFQRGISFRSEYFFCVSNNTWKEKRFAQDVQDCPRPYRQPAPVFRCEDFLLRAMYFLTTSLYVFHQVYTCMFIHDYTCLYMYVFHQVLWRFLCAI